MDADRFFCHRACCNLTKAVCRKRQIRNSEANPQRAKGVPFPVCENCPQGEAIVAELEKDQMIVLPIQGNPANVEAIRRLAIEAEAAGRTLPSLCMLRLCADLCGRDTEYREWIASMRDRS